MKKVLGLCFIMLLTAACQQGGAGGVSKDGLKKMLADNPDILVEAIKKNPAEIMNAIRNAARDAEAAEKKKKLDAAYDKPIQASLRSDELFRGAKDAPLTLVEYSDFYCYYCSKGYETVMGLLKKYDGKIRFVYKHMPVIGGPAAVKAASYYEAIRTKDVKKAMEFHDELYKNQSKLKQGREKYLKEVVTKLKLNVDEISKVAESEKIKARIAADQAEGSKFGFTGTPGFLLNGIPVKGAYPQSHFEGIVEELKKRGKLKL